MFRLTPAWLFDRLVVNKEDRVGKPSPRKHRVRFWVAGASYLYLSFLIALWTLFRMEGEHWWVATLLMFGPRWVFGFPLLAIAPLAVAWHRRVIWVVGVAAFVLLFPIMNLCLPLRGLFVGGGGGLHLRILTCNIHRHSLTPSALAQFIDNTNPDVVLIQEWTSQDQQDLFGKGKWYLHRDGELFAASRYPITSVEDIVQGQWGPAGAAVFYQIEMDGQLIPIFNVHLASPHNQFADAVNGLPEGPAEIQGNCVIRAEQSILIANRARAAGGSKAIVAGDFNTPGDSSLFWEIWDGFTDSFSWGGWGFGNTYYTRWTGTRIDHVVTSCGWNCRACWVGPSVGSPHRPIVADLTSIKAD